MGCGEQESVDESLAVTVVQCDSWFRERMMHHPAPRILSPGAAPPPSSGGSGEGVTLVIGRHWLDSLAGRLDDDFVRAVNEQPEPQERAALDKLFD